MKKALLLALAAVIVFGCKKDPDEPTPTPTPQPTPTQGSMKVEFEPAVGNDELVFNTKYYKNANNDSFTVSMFKYYVSNIVLTKEDNSTHTVANSYFKVDHNTAGKNVITMNNLPVANYKSIQFIIGVDSARNVSGAQEGDLAPSDMFWTWNSGYIFAKFEGTSPKSTANGKMLMYHIGGFKQGPNNGLRTVNISFNGSTANVNGTATPQVHIKSDLAKWFTGPGGLIDFSTLNTMMMPSANSAKVASNYAVMFEFEHVHN